MNMLRLLALGTLLWCPLRPAFAACRGREPCDRIEPDTGAPKPGEGLGGVAVLMKPMPEATTMKTWSFLKESMLKIGEQVKQIMQVRNDMSSLQNDLTSQERAWHEAEDTLNKENAKLRAKIKSLKAEVNKNKQQGLKGQLNRAKQALEEEQRHAKELQNEADMQDKRFQTELKFLEGRKKSVTQLHKEVNDTATAEVARVQAVQLQLQKDAVTMRLSIEEFQDRMNKTSDDMEFENVKSLAKQADLQRQIAAMEAGLKRIQGRLQPRTVFDQQEVSLKQELRKLTDTVLSLQSDQQLMVTECTKEMQRQDQVKCAEEAKLRNRIAEKMQFCNAIQVQNQVLKQDLAKCGIFPMIGQRPAVVAPPTPTSGGLVPVQDPQLQMMFPPAPSPY